MKELLTAIIGKEEELKSRSEQIEREGQVILETGRKKCETLAEEYQTKFQNEKDKRTREVEDQVRDYETGLKAKLQESLKASEARLNGARDRIKKAIADSVLNG